MTGVPQFKTENLLRSETRTGVHSFASMEAALGRI